MLKNKEIVKLKNGMDGVIKDINGNIATVIVKNSIVKVKLEDINGSGMIKKSKSSITFSKVNNISKHIDLHGLTYEDALSILEQYINDILSSKYKTFTIIHGNGQGAMFNVTMEMIEKYNKYIFDFGFAPINKGGSGATIVTLR